jgi:hypothetical protein
MWDVKQEVDLGEPRNEMFMTKDMYRMRVMGPAVAM